MAKPVESILQKTPFIGGMFDEHMIEVVGGAAVAMVLKVLGAGLAFCFNLLLARTFGADGAGVYFLALTVTTIATVFGRMGLDNALLRFTAANAAVGDWKQIKGVYAKGMRFALGASSITALTMLAGAPFLACSVFGKPELTAPMQWMALAVVPMTMLILHGEMLKGLKRIRDSLLVYGVAVPALALGGLFLLGGGYGINGAVWAYTAAAALAALLGVRLWHRAAASQLREIKGHFETSTLLRSSFPLFWVTSFCILNNSTATIALGIWGTKAEVGVFNIAFRTAMLVSLVLNSVNSLAAPKFAELYRKGELVALGSTARNTAKLMTLMAGPILISFLLFPKLIMGIFDAEFREGAVLLSILSVGQFINVATGSVGYVLIMSRNERTMMNIMAFGAAMMILLNVALVPFVGAIGAAIAVSICWSSMSLVGAYMVWSRLGISAVPFIQRKKHS